MNLNKEILRETIVNKSCWDEQEYRKDWKFRNCFLETLYRQHISNDIDIFIETGTASGYTSEIMSKVFEDVHTVEKHVDTNKQNLYIQIALENKNVVFYTGDSSEKLKEISHIVNNKPCVFLLDAHDGRDTPLINELKVIKECFNHDSIIMIDDCEDVGHGNWPKSMKELEGLLKDINKDFKIVDTGMGRKIIIAYVELI